MKNKTNIEETRKLYSDLESKPLTDEEKYRYLMKNDPNIIQFKMETLKKVEKRGLGSYMNDTKWLELQKGVNSLPFPPAYFEKRISDKEFGYNVSNIENPNFYGDWSPFYMEGMPVFFDIEYMIIMPRYIKGRGMLVKGKVIDISKEFKELLLKNNINFEMENNNYVIYGYK